MPAEKRQIASVGRRKNTISEEDLPLPIVVYPPMYGTFIGFKEYKETDVHFCSCSKNAILNAIHLRNSFKLVKSTSLSWNLLGGEFPNEVLRPLIKRNIPINRKQIKYFKFKDNICHECNSIIPNFRFLSEIYGGLFTQNYGWYIRKQGFDYGINIWSDHRITGVINSICPEEILDVMEFDPVKLSTKIKKMVIPKVNYREAVSYKKYEIKVKEQKSLRKMLNEQNRNIWNILENTVRVKTGYKKIGEGWTNETTLYYLVKKLYPKMEVLRHCHPSFLGGLELDIFISDLNVGIEYQGLQHYKPVKHWGGEEALKDLIVRDRKKKSLCKKEGVKLIYFKYDEDINQKIVEEKLNRIK